MLNKYKLLLLWRSNIRIFHFATEIFCSLGIIFPDGKNLAIKKKTQNCSYRWEGSIPYVGPSALVPPFLVPALSGSDSAQDASGFSRKQRHPQLVKMDTCKSSQESSQAGPTSSGVERVTAHFPPSLTALGASPAPTQPAEGSRQPAALSAYLRDTQETIVPDFFGFDFFILW